MRVLGAIALCATLGGCASITRGYDEQINITSDPPGAVATTTGPVEPQPPCVTPCSIKVRRNDNVSIAFEKPGFQPQTITLTSEIVPNGGLGFAGNAVAGGLIGAAIDAGNKAAYDHKPNPVAVTLQPIHQPPQRPAAKPKRSSAGS